MPIPDQHSQKKKKIFNKHIALRYFVTAFLPVWLLGCLLLWLFFYAESQNSRKSLGMNVAHNLELQKESIRVEFVSVISDLKFLSGMVELSGFLDQPDQSIKKKLSEELAVFLKAKGRYDRVSVIDGEGQEVVSADYNDGIVRVTPDDNLHDRSKEYYFRETFRMASNQAYVSPLDLKVEHREVREPFEPMVRLGTPLTDSKGKKKGVIIANYFGQNLIHRVRKIASDQPGDSMFLNRNGYWIKGRTPDEEWGFMFEGRQERSFRHEFPGEWETISREESGQLSTPEGFFSFVTVFPLKGIPPGIGIKKDQALFLNLPSEETYYWKLVTHVPPAVLKGFSRQGTTRFRFILLVMTASLLASYVFLVFAQHYRQHSANLELEKSKMDQILNYGEKVRTITNLNMLIDFVIKQASLILESERCSLMLLDDETGELCIRGAIGLHYDVIRKSKVTLGEGIAGLVAEEGKPLLVEVIDEDERIGKKNAPYYKSKSFLSVPIKLDHKLIGVVNVTDKFDKKNPTYTDLDLKILLAIVRQAAVAIENAQLSKELKYLTITDPLTHLYNYRHLMECLAYEIKRFNRFGRPLCLMIIDVDEFKEYNDAFGQAEGNVLLKNIGRLLIESLREVDIICRYAGDEFVVIMADTDVEKVKTIAEKVRKAVEEAKFKKPMTVSIGIAQGFKDMTRHDIILKADAALHKAKKDGRNKVFCQDR